MRYPILKELENARRNYDTNINLVEGLYFRQKDVVKMIEFYSSSRYLTSGATGFYGEQKDELGRDKPFYQILNAICDVENAAKDIDTKDITITSDNEEHYTESFLMGKDVYEWMKVNNFAKTLNDMRDTHTKYGSLLVKKVTTKDKDGKKTLKLELPEWKNLITDQVDILNGTIIECHWMLPSDMLKMSEWKHDKVKEAIKKVKKQGASFRIPVYEIRGWFPKDYITAMEDGKDTTNEPSTDYTYQLYYIAGDYSDQYATQQDASSVRFTSKLTPLYWEDDTEQVYKYLARKKRAGRAFGVGVMEEGEQAQIWTNDAVLKQTRAGDLASKTISQTASKKLKGRNTLTEVDNGSILEHEDGKPITPVQLVPSGGLQQFDNLLVQWYTQLERATSAYNAQRGEDAPSGTPFRLQAINLQQSNSVFKDLQEELGIFISEIFMDWILPHLAKQLNAEHILAHEFSVEELKEIDKAFTKDFANTRAMEQVLSGSIVTQEDYDAFIQSADEVVKKTKTTRFLKIPKDYYKKVKANVTVNVTGEQANKAAILESLINILTVYAQNPNIAQDPVLTQIFMEIVEISGARISPVSLMASIQEQGEKVKEQQAMQAVQPQPQVPTPDPMSLQANPMPV